MSGYKPAIYDESVVYAFRALFDGKANEGQQKRAMEWLVLNACHIGQVSFSSDQAATAFMEGQRSIGVQVARMREPEALALIQPKRRGKPEAEANGQS